MRFEIKDIDICSDNQRKTKPKHLPYPIDSSKYKKSKKAIIETLLAQKPAGMQPIKKFNAVMVFRTRKDPTNLIKIIFDCLQVKKGAGIIENDKKWDILSLHNVGSGKDMVVIEIKQSKGELFEQNQDSKTFIEDRSHESGEAEVPLPENNEYRADDLTAEEIENRR